MTSEWTMRRVREGDAAGMARLVGHFNPQLTGLTSEAMARRLGRILTQTQDVILVAEAGRSPIGYIHGSPYHLLYERLGFRFTRDQRQYLLRF
ncbi:MAG: hypothetical protein ACFE0O_15410 [Opitutales bacterium]